MRNLNFLVFIEIEILKSIEKNILSIKKTIEILGFKVNFFIDLRVVIFSKERLNWNLFFYSN